MKFLVIDDNKPFRDAACLLIESEGHCALPAASGDAGLALLEDDKFDAVLLDVKLGRENGLEVLPRITKKCVNLPVVMVTTDSTVTVEAMRHGAVDFLAKPLDHSQLRAAVARLQSFTRMNREIERLEEEVKETKSSEPALLLDFDSPAMRPVTDVIARAAKSSATILITGESGTGKSALARTIHGQSHLADKPFVTVSCASLTRELLESELFGHTKGSFTGAIKDHWGKVNAAIGGTLFLDEIGDLPLDIQPKLLRLLQEQEYERIGETITRKANIRVIAATNRDLKKRIAEGAFREDLYFRLNVITVEMPPLRARPGDLLRFANHYLRHFAAECGRKMEVFSKGTVNRMEGHSWPGNLRELRNAIQRAVILAASDRVTPEDLPVDLQIQGEPALGDLISLKKLEEMHIRKVMVRTGSIVESAKVLGIDQATIYRKRRGWRENKRQLSEAVC